MGVVRLQSLQVQENVPYFLYSSTKWPPLVYQMIQKIIEQ